MSEEKKRILQMLDEGKITSEEAMMLLDQLDTEGKNPTPPPVYSPDAPAGGSGRMLRVRVVSVEEGKPKPSNVNINLPLKAARIAGRMITTMMPHQAREALEEEGINIADMDFDALIDSLEETGGDIVNVTHEEDNQQVFVRVYVE